ncbi:hypothetical protein LDENG_00078490 [Lucifuga dentata]|nr:hypothetical protein LDENG_00078490 [Lucifuga dentata]
MAPNENQIKQQTSSIIKYLLDDEEATGFRQHEEDYKREEGCIEPDGPGSDDNFDPVLIADKLRSVADQLNDDIRFKAVLSDLQRAAAEEAMEAAFSKGVNAICQTHVAQKPDVASEMNLIRASVALGLYLKKKSPELKNKVQRAMTTFLNSHVSSWVAQQGGWDKVAVV